MSVDKNNARKPITHVFYGVTVPAYGSKLTLTNGVPGTGVEVGVLGGPISFNTTRGSVTLDSETNEAPLDYKAAAHSLVMSFMMKEMRSDLMQYITNGETLTAADGTKLTTVGTNTDLVENSWVAVWETCAGSGDYEYAMVYDGVVTDGGDISWEKANFNSIPIAITGRPVVTRPAKDQLGHMNTLV
jgi:hypothetical protein